MKIKLEKESSRHHFIPEFYCKQFSNEQKKIVVFDKEEFKIKRRINSPKQIFFKWDDNTSTLGRKEIDIAERVYGEIDNKHSKLIKLINNSKADQFILTENVLTSLKEFISFMFWRNPSSSIALNKILDERDFSELGLIAHKRTSNQIITSQTKKTQIFTDSTFRKLAKQILAFSTQIYPNKNDENYQWHILYYDSNNVIIGDNPFIFKGDVRTKTNVLGELFIPISKNKLIFCSSSRIKKAPDILLSYHNLMQIHQAVQHIVGCSEDYLYELTNAYKRLSLKAKYNLKKELFKLIELN